jgi:ATP-dependent DNA ligase
MPARPVPPANIPTTARAEFSYIGPDMLRSAFNTGPRFIKPELPTLVPEPPTGEGWIHEIKYDGYRTLIAIDRGQVRAFTRSGHDWTVTYRRVVDACSKLACRAAVLDGEMVVQDEHGITDFHALCSAIYRARHRIIYFAFDLLHLDGQDLRRRPTHGPARADQEADQAGQALSDPVQRSCRGRWRRLL